MPKNTNETINSNGNRDINKTDTSNRNVTEKIIRSTNPEVEAEAEVEVEAEAEQGPVPAAASASSSAGSGASGVGVAAPGGVGGTQVGNVVKTSAVSVVVGEDGAAAGR